MEYVDGGSLTVSAALGIITGAMAVAGGIYTAGTVAGKRYYLMYGNQYYRDKYIMNTAIAIASITHPVLGLGAEIFKLGFENEYFGIIQGIN